MARGRTRRFKRQIKIDTCPTGKKWWTCEFAGHPGFAGCCVADACKTWSLCSEEQNFFSGTSTKSTSTVTVTRTRTKSSSTASSSTSSTTSDPTPTSLTTSTSITTDSPATISTTAAGPGGTPTVTSKPTASHTGTGGSQDGPDDDGLGVGLPVGGAVGGLVFLLVVVFGVVWFLRRRKARAHQRSYTPDMFEPDFGHEPRWTPSRLVAKIKKKLGLGGLKSGRWEGRLRDNAMVNAGGTATGAAAGGTATGAAAGTETATATEAAGKEEEANDGQVGGDVGSAQYPNSPGVYQRRLDEHRLSNPHPPVQEENRVPVPVHQEEPRPVQDTQARRLSAHQELPIPVESEFPQPIQGRPFQQHLVQRQSAQNHHFQQQPDHYQPMQHQPIHLQSIQHGNHPPVQYYQHPPALVPADPRIMDRASYPPHHGPSMHGIPATVPLEHDHSFPGHGYPGHGMPVNDQQEYGMPSQAIPMHPTRASYPPMYQPVQYQPYRPDVGPNQAQPPYNQGPHPDRHS